MNKHISNILIVDDNEIQASLIQHHLKSLNQPHNIEITDRGDSAWEMLNKNPDKYDVVLLDRDMPEMDGIEVLTLMMRDPVLKHIPVILQTALAKQNQIIEGMAAGAHYYLTKPYEKDLLLTIVGTALEEREQYLLLHNALQKQNKTIKHLKSAVFEFQTVDEANDIAILLANTSKEPDEIINGLAELLVNAVEHGNLNLSYEEKSELKEHGDWKAELDRRLQLPEYRNRMAQVKFKHDSKSICFTISDEGNGFDWRQYMEFAPERMMDNHGRGIAVANKLCFSKVEYQGKGNIVSATLIL